MLNRAARAAQKEQGKGWPDPPAISARIQRQGKGGSILSIQGEGWSGAQERIVRGVLRKYRSDAQNSFPSRQKI